MMFLMPFFLRRLGIKKVFLIGIAAWVLRYVFFALGATPNGGSLVILGIALHGFCYAFFFVSGQVYVDMATPTNVRGQCQGMNIFFTQGLGMMIGALVTNKLAAKAFGALDSTAAEALPLWPKLWWPLCAAAAVLLVAFAVAFHPPKEEAGEAVSV